MFKKALAGLLMGLMASVCAIEASAASRSSSSKSYSSRSYSKPKPSFGTRKYANPRNRSAYSPSRPYARPKAVPQRPTVINKTYNNYGGSNGYRGNSGGGFGGGMGGSGPGLGTAILGGALGAAGGMMLHDALTEDEGEKALKMQQEQQRIDSAVQKQQDHDRMERIEQKLDAQSGQKMIPEPSDDFFKVNPGAM